MERPRRRGGSLGTDLQLDPGRSLPGRCSGTGHHPRSQSTAKPSASTIPQPASGPIDRDARGLIPPFAGHSRRLLKGLQYVPRVIVTDKLRSYGVAQRQILPEVEHRQSRYLNNRAENSHRPTRRRERHMQRFKSPKQAQDFLFAHSFIYGHFRPRRHRLAASVYRAARTEAFNIWQQENFARHVS
jgi:hypothetical protein